MDNPFTTLIERMEERLKEHHDSIEKLLSIKEKPSAEHDEVDLLTPKESAKLLRISLPTLHRWQKKGKVKCYGIAGSRYYKRSELLESLTELK